MRKFTCFILVLLTSCARNEVAEHAHEDEGWSVTAWGNVYEIFAECDPLIAGQTARSHTHVTVLRDFSPLRSGKVSAVLRATDGQEIVFAQDHPARDGIFSVEIAPSLAGPYHLVFRVESEAGNEDILAGVVRVGTGEAPGGPVGEHTHAETGVETVSFLKEQQWRTEFATARTTPGNIATSIHAPAAVRAAAGAEVLLTAPLDGVVSADTRVFVGRSVSKGEVLVRLAPRSPSSVTFSELEAEATAARARVARLEDLLKIGAASQAELEAARAKLAAIEPQLAAAKGSAAGDLAIHAPFAGRVAESNITAGAAVSAGDPLVRVVRTPPVWVQAAVAPRDAAALRGSPSGLVLEAPGTAPFAVTDNVRLISVAPEVDRSTGTVAAILEVEQELPYPLGSLVTAEILLQDKISGIVVPAGAIVDDAGTPVVYLQIEGESFERRSVTIVAKQASSVVIEGVANGERIVVRGGPAIRRASLLSSGEAEGHVH